MTTKEAEMFSIPFIDGYKIDKDFNIWSMPKKIGSGACTKLKKIKIHISKNGYCCFVARKDKKQKTILLHRAIASVFIENKLGKPCVNHINGIKTDNRVENLEWCTHSENTKHAFDNNLCSIGEKVKAEARKNIIKAQLSSRKFSKEQVIFIYKNIGTRSLRWLARNFNVSLGAIQHIRDGISYKEYKDEYYGHKICNTSNA